MISKIYGKYFIPFLLISSAILFTATIAVAAIPPAESASKVIEQNPLTVLAIIFMGFCNVGSMVYLAKRYMARVDRDSEIIPELIESTKSLRQSADKLVEVTTRHEKEITIINTIHEIKGCNKAIEK